MIESDLYEMAKTRYEISDYEIIGAFAGKLRDFGVCFLQFFEPNCVSAVGTRMDHSCEQ